MGFGDNFQLDNQAKLRKGNNPTQQLRFSIKQLLLGVALASCCIAMSIAIEGAGITLGDTDKVSEGMTREEIVFLIGQPHRIEKNGSWIYDVWFFKNLLIQFDDEGRAYPPTI